MSANVVCDCCRSPMGDYDAGQIPVVLRGRGIEVVVTVVRKDGEMPNVRPECLKTILGEAEVIYPARRQAIKAGRVVDPEAAESEDDEKHHPVPMRAAQ